MNTFMWLNPITARHIKQLRLDFGNVKIVGPIEKMLACGDEGVGGMAEVPDIVAAVEKILPPSPDFSG